LKRTPITAALLFAASVAALAQSEGIAEFKGSTMTGGGETLPAHGKFFLSKAAFRMDWEVDTSQTAPGKKKGAHPDQYRMTLIQKISEPDRMYMLNPERKTYSVIHTDKARESSVPGETYTVKKLGHDSVAGLSCEKALLTSSSGAESEVCVTRELIPSSAWLAVMNRQNTRSGFGKALHDHGLDGFPIRMISRHKGGVNSTFELVRFQKTSVASSSFEIPAGYSEASGSSVMMTPEQEKAMKDALSKMTPEQRKKYEEMMKKQQGGKQ
jgi:hypothetical protein